MLTIEELERRLANISLMMDKLTKERTRLRVARSRYKRLLQALKEMQDFCE